MLTTSVQRHHHRTAPAPHRSNWTCSSARASSSSRCARCTTAAARGASGPCPSAASRDDFLLAILRLPSETRAPFSPFSQPRNAEGERAVQGCARAGDLEEDDRRTVLRIGASGRVHYVDVV